MELISDILLIAGALGAAFYCIVLSRRLSRFTDLDKGVGGAIAVLSAQVDDMTTMLGRAQVTASGSTETLRLLTERAEDVAKRLELLVASMHDLPEAVRPEPQPDAQRADAPQSAPDAGPETGAKAPPPAPQRAAAPPAEAPSQFQSRRIRTQEAAE